jgi:hypothetical protein
LVNATGRGIAVLLSGSPSFYDASFLCLKNPYNRMERSYSFIPYFRQKLASVSEFTRGIKLDFARYYNKLHNRRGYFWGDRFKSVLVENGRTLINCLAYIDLNPIRAAFKRYIIFKNEKIPNPVKGIDDVFSLKRLSESI